MVPYQFGPPGQTVPIKFGPPGQMVPQNLVPNQFGSHITKSSKPVPLDKQNNLGTICPGGPNIWYHLSMGIEFYRDDLSRGINFIGIICPGGKEVGDQKSGDQMVWDQMRRSPNAI